MNELIKIDKGNIGKQETQTVNARELHEFLESRQDFSTWIKGRIKIYGFTQDTDFIKFHNSVEQVSGAKNRIEYHLTIDMAKELSMVERNEKGKQARKYFIECERQLKEPGGMTEMQLVAATAQHMVQVEQKQSEHEDRLKKIERRYDQATAGMKALPPPSVTPLKISSRLVVARYIRNYCVATGVAHHIAWTKLYSEFNYRYHTMLKVRAKNMSKKEGRKIKQIDIVEMSGKLAEIYAIAQEIFVLKPCN
jgi:phage anti-repressor protein